MDSGTLKMVALVLFAATYLALLAFPKIQNGACLMMETPSTVDPEQLKMCGIAVVDEEK